MPGCGRSAYGVDGYLSVAPPITSQNPVRAGRPTEKETLPLISLYRQSVRRLNEPAKRNARVHSANGTVRRSSGGCDDENP